MCVAEPSSNFASLPARLVTDFNSNKIIIKP